ncbi:MAG: class I SAM-dependent methyltransferase [Verrucomicrobiota bacterium]
MALRIIRIERCSRVRGHPWVDLKQLAEISADLSDGESVALIDSTGYFLGCGIFDRQDPVAAWRRYSLAEDIAFDEAYIASAIVEAMHKRAEESCQRLVSSDADYLPGLIVDLFNDVARVTLETNTTRQHIDLITEVIRDNLSVTEIVIDSIEDPRTASGQGLRGRWIEIDDIEYRIDLLNTDKPAFFLDQREQHALVGSLCEGRTVLDAFSHSGAFALQAARAGAERVVALDVEENYVKAIGANAQQNRCPIETVTSDALKYISGCDAGTLDGIILDPPSCFFADRGSVEELHRKALITCASGGLLATYCRDNKISGQSFERLVADAAACAGREARVFARTGQPFDFPSMLHLPESNLLKGLILEVE